MPPRFSDEQLSVFQVDPKKPAAWARCPFCGEDLVMGYGRETQTLKVGHTAVKAPDGSFISGCEPFRRVALVNPLEFLRMCRSASVHWELLSP